jgi:hypothetical protein
VDGTTDSSLWTWQTDDYGVVDKLEAESIVTSFYRVILPIWPEHSAYVIRLRDGSERRIKIPLQKKSVLLGYLRAPVWFLAIVCVAPAIFATEAWTKLLVPGLVLAVIAAVLTFVAGKLPEHERLRRQLLRRVVGFGAPPELLPDALCAEVRMHLRVMWDTRSRRSTYSADWREAIANGEASELLVAMAEYHRDPEVIAAAAANFANKVWN